MPHRALPTRNCHLLVLWGQPWEQGGTQQVRSRWSKFLSASWSKGSPGRFVQQGCVPGHAAHGVRRFGHPFLHVVSPGASEGVQSHLFGWKCPFQERAGQVMSLQQHVWASSVLSVSWYDAAGGNNSSLVMALPGHFPGSLHCSSGKEKSLSFMLQSRARRGNWVFQSRARGLCYWQEISISGALPEEGSSFLKGKPSFSLSSQSHQWKGSGEQLWLPQHPTEPSIESCGLEKLFGFVSHGILGISGPQAA